MIDANPWKLLQENCTGCGICADVCSYEAIEMSLEMAYPQSIPGACTACGECEQECPFDAIDVAKEDPSPRRGSQYEKTVLSD